MVLPNAPDLFLSSKDPRLASDSESEIETASAASAEATDPSTSSIGMKRSASTQLAPPRRLKLQVRETPLLHKSGFAEKSNDLIKLVDELIGCGAALDVDVPRIAILGNQSSGKSSVIEAISGISLPRSRGTCTRCPIEVRLVRDVNVDWTCQVAIRFADFTACQSDSDSKAQAPTEIPFGGAITDPKMVEDRIRRAQLAALTPDVRTRQGGLQTFLAASAESIGQNPTIEFTKNTICVTIQDPTGVNLSFVDLPGLISNAGQNKSDANIKLIEDVAIQTISQPNCLILLTITCTDDIQNQSGAALARQVDPQGLRTIGVLTKTDAIQEGDHSAWFDLLCGRRETLKYGYYAVKNPSTQQLQHGIAYEAARTAEQDFFKGQHWIQLPAHVQQRLGVNHLTSRLSALLKGLIQQQLPGMLANMNQALGETRARLDKLPEHVNEADSVRFVSDKCNAVAAAVKAAVQGSKGTGSSALLRQIRQQAIRTFKDDIVEGPPLFFGKDALYWSSVRREALYAVLHIEENEDTKWERDATLPGQKVVYTFEEIRQMIAEIHGLQLPGNVPYELKLELIHQSLRHLPESVSVAYDHVKGLVCALVNDELEKTFGDYGAGGLLDMATSLWDKLNSSCDANTTRILEAMQKCELLCIFTSNETEFEQLASEQLALYQMDRAQEMDHNDWADDDVLRLCAEVVAYYNLKSKSFVDVFPSIIITHYLNAIGDGFQETLSAGLGIHDKHAHKVCRKLLEADEETELTRRDLLASKSRLENGLKAMKRFGAA